MILKKGSTIIEVLLAATLISIAILASLSLSSASQRQTDSSRDLNKATVFNNQVIDWSRNMRTLMGWKSFVNKLDTDTAGSSVTYCLNSLPTSTDEFIAVAGGSCALGYYIPGTPGSTFQREITFTMTGTPVTSVTVVSTTYWADKAHSVSAEGKLTEWQ